MRTILVILSLSLSIILPNTVFNFSNSVAPENAIQNMINFDFCIGQSSLLDYYRVSEESALSQSFIQAVEQQDGSCGSDRNRHIPQPALRDRHPVIQTAADRNVIRKGLDSGHVGLLLFERLLAIEPSRKRVLAVFVERRQPLVIADKQIRGVHDHRRAVGRKGLDLEQPVNSADIARC